MSYQYDLAGNRTRVTHPDGYFVEYVYDALNRVTQVRENGTAYVVGLYTYDPLSLRTGLAYGNGTSVAYGYTASGDMTSLAHAWASSGNGAGTGVAWTNAFTKAHQIKTASLSNAAFQFLPSAFGTTAYTPANALNQYVAVTPPAAAPVSIAYDAAGNLTGDGVLTLGYDPENRLITAAKAGMTASYDYDPLGRRQAKSVNGTVTKFLSDGAEEIAEHDAAGALLRRYIPGPGTDMPLAMVAANGARSFVHTDRQGSTVALSNDAGVVSEGPYTYDAYGNGAAAKGFPFKFTGRRLDPETGLYYYRARYYSSALGRFLQTDPIGTKDQMNLYGYVANDPMNGVDPTGLTCKQVGKKTYDCKVDDARGLTEAEEARINKAYTVSVNKLMRNPKQPVKVTVNGRTMKGTAGEIGRNLVKTWVQGPVAGGKSSTERANMDGGVLSPREDKRFVMTIQPRTARADRQGRTDTDPANRTDQDLQKTFVHEGMHTMADEKVMMGMPYFREWHGVPYNAEAGRLLGLPAEDEEE